MVYFIHVLNQFNNFSGVTHFVVVPAHYFNEVVVQRNTGVGIENRSLGLTYKVVRNNSVFGVTQYAFQLAFRSSFHSSTNVGIRSRLLQTAGQVNHRHVGGGNTESHTGQFTVQLRNYFTYCFSSTGRRRNNVLTGTTSASPVLHRGTINSLLGSSGCVNGSHQTFNNAKLVVQHLGNGGQTVGGTRSIRNKLHVFGVLVEVYTTNKHGGVVF